MKTIYSKNRRSIQLVLGRAISLRFARNGHFMKTTIFVGLCVALGASFISVRANDTPAQAAARAALEQKLNDLSHPQTEPPPATNTPSGAVVVQPGQSATNVTETVPAKAVTPQTAPAATTPVAAPAAAAPPLKLPPLPLRPLQFPLLKLRAAATAPAAEVPATAAPAAEAPAAVAPAAEAPAVVAPAAVAPAAEAPATVTRRQQLRRLLRLISLL